MRGTADTRGTVWFTGLPGAGKTTVATVLTKMLDRRALRVFQLDGDVLRQGLNADLGFSEEDRRENVRRVGEVALLSSSAGHLSLVTVISPFATGRKAVRARHDAVGVPFVEVFVDTPLEVCEQRDPKGLYARARRGELACLTGVSSPYEVPVEPDLVLSTPGRTPEESALEVLGLLERLGLAGGG